MNPAKDVEDLTMQECIDLLNNIRATLWLEAGEWNPEKEWDSDTTDCVARAFHDFGLGEFC